MPKSSGKKRPLGLLGVPVENESDDDDYRPPAALRSSSPPAKRPKSKAATRAAKPAPTAARQRAPRSQALHADDDVPLAERLGRHSSSRQAAGTSSQGAVSASWGHLPDDLLGMLFARLCKKSGATAAILSSVCSSWRAAALARPELWEILDLASCLKTPAYQLLTARGRWSQVQEVILSGWPADGPALVAALSQHCPLVHSFTLTTATLQEADLSTSLQRWPLLTSLKLQHVICRPLLVPVIAPLVSDPPPPGGVAGTPSAGDAAAMGQAEAAPAEAGPHIGPQGAEGAEQQQQQQQQQQWRLKQLVLRFCPGVNSQLLKMLCPPIVPAIPTGAGPLGALRELDLSHSGSVSFTNLAFCVERLQHAAPLLEVLKLTGLGMVPGWSMPAPRQEELPHAEAPGFPCLRSCWLGFHGMADVAATMRSHSRSCIANRELLRICGSSPRLEELELIGTHVTAAALRQLPAQVRTLLVSRSPLCSDEGFAAIGERYGSTIEEVQAAGGSSLLGAGVAALAGCRRLRALDVSSSSVDEQGLRLLLGGLAGDSLQRLEISSCRSVPRHLRTAAAGGGVASLKRAMHL